MDHPVEDHFPVLMDQMMTAIVYKFYFAFLVTIKKQGNFTLLFVSTLLNVVGFVA